MLKKLKSREVILSIIGFVIFGITSVIFIYNISFIINNIKSATDTSLTQVTPPENFNLKGLKDLGISVDNASETIASSTPTSSAPTTTTPLKKS